MSEIARLCRSIGYDFSDSSLLRLALTHRSVGADNNERLEFLGDAVLGLVISDELFARFPEATEGQLSRLRARLVRRDTLAEVARRVGLGEYLQLGSGELKSGGHRRSSILADATEAVLGAVYLDGGMERASEVLLALFEPELTRCRLDANLKDAKTELQEFLQARGKPLPEYAVVSITGEAHAQSFEVQCVVEGMSRPFTGLGSSRRKAEQAAARKAMDSLVQ